MFYIFEVYDYKGGELSADINLSKDDFISSMIDRVSLLSSISSKEIDVVQLEVSKILNSDKFFITYPNNDKYGFCGKLYKMVDGRLRRLCITDYINDFAQAIVDYNKKI